jgi:hypothetical protein
VLRRSADCRERAEAFQQKRKLNLGAAERSPEAELDPAITSLISK